MKKCFVFCHGFGFDKSFWDNLRPYFIEEECAYLDLGYFAEQDQFDLTKYKGRLIGIGHSLGLIKLLNFYENFESLFGLNSFIDFLGNEEVLKIQRKCKLKFLMNQFNKSPFSALSNFYSNCGMPRLNKEFKYLNIARAREDLNLLTSQTILPKEIPLTIIGSKDDIIVPPELIYDNFRNYCNVSIDIMGEGKHALGFLQPRIIYEKIINSSNAY